MDVCFVNMPRSGVTRPALGPSLLKAVLARAGIEATVLYPCLWYVDYVGPRSYELLTRTDTQECLVDWLFAPAAFPDHDADPDAFLDLLLRDRAHPFPMPEAALRPLLLELRGRTTHFVDWAAQQVLARSPRIVGCSSTFEQHVASLALLRRIRALAPSVVTMMGGANCESVMGRTTHERFPWVDFVVSGDADGSIVALCRRIVLDGREMPADKVPPAVFAPVHRREGYPRTAGGDGYARGSTRDLRALPLPDYDDYFFRELPEMMHGDAIRPGLVHESSRGCWWGVKNHCTFCGLNGGGMGYRAKPAEQVERELDALVRRYDVPRVQMADNIIDLGYFDALLPRLAAREEPLVLFYETKANLTREQVRRFRDAGVTWLQPGIESLHSAVLRLMRKGVGAWQNVRLLKWCRELGIRVAWSVIAGFPGEDDAWYAEVAGWLPWLEHLEPGRFSALRFDRYSPYFEAPERHGLRLEPCPAFAHVYPLPSHVLADLVYFFTDRGRDLLAEIRGGARPGARAVFEAMEAWARRHHERPDAADPRRGPARLELVDDATAVLDTRRCAVVEHEPVDAVDVALLRALDDAPSERRLDERMADLAGATTLAQRVGRLVARRWVLPIDGRLLSLVLEAPRPLPPMEDLPAGSYRLGPRREAIADA